VIKAGGGQGALHNAGQTPSAGMMNPVAWFHEDSGNPIPLKSQGNPAVPPADIIKHPLGRILADHSQNAVVAVVKPEAGRLNF
jgi:hypothetical protein